MKFRDIIVEELINEENSAIILDIDKTLVVPKNIFIYRKLPTDKKEIALTPEQYAKETVSSNTKKFYDYRDFRNADAVARSITTGIPIVSNLKIMDNYVNKGWKIGVLTARGMEDVIHKTMKEWLKYRDKKGNLQGVGDKLVRNIVNAVNDDSKSYTGTTDFEKKANVMRGLAKKFDRIIYIDDDTANVKAVKKMLRDEKIKNVYVRLATGE